MANSQCHCIELLTGTGGICHGRRRIIEINRHHPPVAVSFNRMKANVRIALIGEFNPEVLAHVAIPKALKLAADALAYAVEPAWAATPLLDRSAEKQLS